MTPIVEDDGRGVNVPPSKASNVSTKESTEKTMDAADATETSNKTKLNEDATKIVRAIKKLHVPAKSNSSLDGCELEKKKGIQLKNGVQLSYNVDVLKKNVNLSDNYKSSEMCQISTEKNGLKSEKENTLKCADENLSTRKSVRIEGKIVVEKNRSTKEDQDFSENVQVKHEDDVIHDFDHEEWEIVDEVHTDTSTCSESCVNEKIKRKSPIQSPDPFLTPTTPLSSSVKEVTALTARLCNAAAGNSSYFQKKATSTLETTENSAEKNENSEEDNTSEEGMQMDVTKVVEQIINRLPDNENGDVVEKLNVSSELSTSSDDVKSNSPTMMSEFSLAASLKRRCKDDNGEKSPLVCTVKKVRLEADPKQECSSSALKTMLKILPKEKVKKLRRKELEELISKEISKYLTSSNYSEIARLQQKVAQLEKSVGYWRKQVGHLQKQHIEDDIAIQRKAQNLRRLGTGPVVKVVTRSVGIQVQTQIPSVLRFNRMVPSELVLGETSRSGVRNCTSTPPVSMMKLKSSSVVPVTAKPVISGAGLAKVSTAGYQSQVSKPLILSLPRTYAKTSTISNVNVTVQNRQMITTNAVTTRPVTSIANKLPASVSVSILQPKSTNLTSVSTSAPSNLVVNPVTVPTTIVPKVASVVAPSSTVRTMLDSQRRVPPTNISSNNQPVPTRLIPNQAAAKSGTTVRSSPQSVSSGPSPTTVKIIDLTADEEEANAQLQKVRALQLLTSGSSAVSGTTLIPIKSSPPMSTTQRPVTLLTTPVGQSIQSTPLILSNTTSSGASSNAQAVRLSATSVRQIAPSVSAPPPPLVSQSLVTSVNSGSLVNTVSPAPRVTYLMPATSVTVMRPPQPIYVSPTNQPRMIQQVAMPRNLAPTIPTILLQRGTTLSPVTSAVSPASVTQAALRPVNSLTTAVRATLLPSTPQNSLLVRELVTQSSQSPSVAKPIVATPQATNVSSNSMSTTNVNSINQAIVVSRVTPKHPAPLPAGKSYPDQPNLKAIPPKPALKISKVNDGIVLSWNMNLNTLHAEIGVYQLFAYQETSAPPSTSLWKNIGDVKALALPMACTLTQFVEGHKYHFAVRAVDVHNRTGPFSEAGSILLQSNTSSAAGSNNSGIRV